MSHCPKVHDHIIYSSNIWPILSSFEFWILRSFWGGNVNQQQIAEIGWWKCSFCRTLDFWCISSWWFQPIWKISYSQNGNLPQIGMNIKSIWNHQVANKLHIYHLFNYQFQSPLPYSLGETNHDPHEGIPNGKPPPLLGLTSGKLPQKLTSPWIHDSWKMNFPKKTFHGNPGFLHFWGVITVVSYNPYFGGCKTLHFSMGCWGPRVVLF